MMADKLPRCFPRVFSAPRLIPIEWYRRVDPDDVLAMARELGWEGERHPERPFILMRRETEVEGGEVENFGILLALDGDLDEGLHHLCQSLGFMAEVAGSSVVELLLELWNRRPLAERVRWESARRGGDWKNIIGQWPGDETDEEIAAALADLDPERGNHAG